MFVFLIFVSILSVQSIFAESCNCVAFRLDDVQDYWITESQMAVMDTFKMDKTPITIGIIANFFGTDPSITGYVQEAIQTDGWEFEVSNHGYNHENFPSFTLAEQENLLKMGVAKTLATLPTLKSITTFIPPFNAFDNDTLTALIATGFTHFSSQVDLDPPPYPFSGEELYSFPINAATSDMNNEVYFDGVSWAVTWKQIQQQLAQFGFAAVMMHPQEFAERDADNNPTPTVNITMILNLEQLINTVKSNGLKFATLGTIEKDV